MAREVQNTTPTESLTLSVG